MTTNNFLLHFFVQDCSKCVVFEGPGLFEFVHKCFVSVLFSENIYTSLLIKSISLLLEDLGDHHLLVAEQILRLFLVEDDCDKFTVVLKVVVVLDTEDVLDHNLFLLRKQAVDVVMHLSLPNFISSSYYNLSTSLFANT